MTCPWQMSVAAYALGTLDPAARDDMAQHLRACAECRATLGPITGLPGLLARVRPAEAEAGPAVPDPRLLDRLVAAAVAERRGQRHRVLAAAAAVFLLVALGVGAIVASRDTGPTTVTAINAVSGSVHARVWLHPSEAGTGLDLELSGVAAEQRCRLVAVDAAGHREVAGTWEATYTGTAVISGTTAIPATELTRLVVETLDHRTLVEVQLSPP